MRKALKCWIVEWLQLFVGVNDASVFHYEVIRCFTISPLYLLNLAIDFKWWNFHFSRSCAGFLGNGYDKTGFCEGFLSFKVSFYFHYLFCFLENEINSTNNFYLQRNNQYYTLKQTKSVQFTLHIQSYHKPFIALLLLLRKYW